jgi:hypothetical protein
MNASMSTIMGFFQIFWVYYGLLIASRPVVVWNLIGVAINFLSVGAYFHFKATKKPLRRLDGENLGECVMLTARAPVRIKDGVHNDTNFALEDAAGPAAH